MTPRLDFRAPLLDAFWQDLRFGLRVLIKHPGFSLVAILTLALGIGANTAMFSIINKVLYGRLPFKDADRVMFVYQRQSNGNGNVFSMSDYLEWRRQSDLLAHMSALQPAGFALGVGDQPEQILGARLSFTTFDVLGVPPAIGRPFTADEDRPGAGEFVLLSDTLWKTRFASDANVVGTKIDIDASPHTILGVMPAGFYVLANTELAWEPLQLPAQDPAAASRTIHAIWVLARQAPGMSLQQEQLRLDSIAARLHTADPDDDAGYGVILQTYRDASTSTVKPALWLLMGCVAFVLLIACSNVANLLLVRAAGRRTEIWVRLAVGARRGGLVRQLLTESLLLALLGGIVGLLFACAGVRALVALNPASIPDVASVSIEPAALVFTAVICLTVTALFGVVPALSVSRVDIGSVLRDGSRTSSSSGRRHRAALVVAETALASVLLISAGLMLKSLWKIQTVQPGFSPEGLLVFSVPAPHMPGRIPALFYRQVAAKVGELPGVQSVALARNVPLSGTDPSMPVAVDGGPLSVADGQIVTRLRVVGPGYFGTLKTPLLQGRELSDQDTSTSQPVVVISQSLAQRYWPEGNPIGHVLRPNIADAPWYTVVGVAADVRHLGLDQVVEPTAYYPYTQVPKSTSQLLLNSMTIVLRASGDIAGLREPTRQAVASVDGTVPVFRMNTMDQMLEDAGSLRHFDMWLIAVFAGLALALAAVGVYGVMAYSVSQRTREIGIFIALGAQRGNVLKIMLSQGLNLALAGVALGVVGALALTRLMRSLLYEVSPTDLPTIASVSMMVFVLVLAACLVPSLRATRIDPI
ncbi:MAG TPA: ABC transporter permease, partial [Blastocatellia bacterium]